MRILMLCCLPLAFLKMVRLSLLTRIFRIAGDQWGSDYSGRSSFSGKRQKMMPDFLNEDQALLSPRTEQSCSSSSSRLLRLSRIQRTNTERKKTPPNISVPSEELFKRDTLAPAHNLPKRTVSCGIDLRTTCRLIGLHSRSHVERIVQFSIGQFVDTFSVHHILDIGSNLKCIVARVS